MIAKPDQQDDLNAALSEAKQWLSQQQESLEAEADRGRALINFQHYLSSVENAVAPPGIRIASQVLSRYITDQFDWSAPYCAAITEFQRKIDRIGREMEWTNYKASESYRPLNP